MIMIRKILSNEYLKRLDNMDADMRDEYLKNVGEWLSCKAPLLIPKIQDPLSAFQNAIQCSAGWNDAECMAWNDGARLLTALIGKADTWLPEMLYTKAAKRTIKKMVQCLKENVNGNDNGNDNQQTESAGAETSNLKPETKAQPAPKKHTQQKTSPLPDSEGAGAGLQPVRPKHIDQYVHLLSEDTQRKAEKLKQLYTDLDAARENMRLLMNDAHGSAKDRAAWAGKATRLDNQIRDIYKVVDREWDELVKSGRVVVDDLGNAMVVASAENPAGQESPEEKPAELTKEQRERVRTLRHFLKDTRRGNGKTREEHIKKWNAFYKEMVEIAGPDSVTDKVKEAAQHYGIELPENMP